MTGGRADRTYNLGEGQKQVIVRMPDALHAAAVERARQEERSLAQLIRHVCRLYVNRRPPFEDMP